MIGYAGCTSDHSPQTAQHAELQNQQSANAVQKDSLQNKKVPEMPKLVKQTVPVYPEEARKKGIQGEIMVQILVGTDGSVKEATIVSNKTGSKDFEKAALDAVKQWKFEPGKLDGKPVEVNVVVPIKFKLDDEKK
jgi:protein TonB